MLSQRDTDPLHKTLAQSATVDIQWAIVVYRQLSNFSAISWREQVNFQWDNDEIRFLLDQHAGLDFYSGSSLKQQSTDRHVAPFGTLFWFRAYQSSLFLLNTVLSGEATNTGFKLFGLTRLGSELEASTLTITPPMRFGWYTTLVVFPW